MIVKKLYLLLLYSIPLLFTSCSKNEFEEESLVESHHISICVLGNSYSNDSFNYVPFILKQYGITCSIHIYCRPNGSLQDLEMEWSEGYKSVTHYYTDTRVDKKWRSSSIRTAREVLDLERWDIVSIQQFSKLISNEESYFPYLDHVIDSISNSCLYPVKIAWFMAYNRANDTNVQGNLKTQKKIVDNHCFNLIFPVATTIFNCQANDHLSILGDSKYGKLYSSDNVHLQDGLPRYAASLAIVEALLREYTPYKSVLGDNTRPDQKWIKSIGGISSRGKPVGVNDDYCLLAQKAAVNANNSFFEIIE